MNIEPCGRFETLAREGGEALLELREHAGNCEACAVALAEWDELSTSLAAMHEEWESPALWDRIEAGLARERESGGWVMRFTRRNRPLLQIAAAILILVSIGAVAFRFLGKPAEDPVAQWAARESAIDEVERAERAHIAAIERLASTLEPQIESSSEPIILSYREKLMLLDEAIAECRLAIETNRSNEYLRKQLLAVYTEKQLTLIEIQKETRNVR